MSSPQSEKTGEWKTVTSKRNSKRKSSSPVDKETKPIRRYLSSSLPDLNEMNSMSDSENENLNSTSNPQGDL
jgi:hypothetical protein